MGRSSLELVFDAMKIKYDILLPLQSFNYHVFLSRSRKIAATMQSQTVKLYF